MAVNMNQPAATSDREMVLTRVFDAPRALVFKAWTDPKHIVHWWGPNGFTTTMHEMEVRPGGMWRFIMHSPDGTDYPNRIVYREIVEPERLVYRHGDDSGNEATMFDVTVTFVEENGKTTLTMRSVLPTRERYDEAVGFGAIELGNQTLARLAAYLPTM
jgi:uncharacterized protein YndB with AHSA1/START domain